MQVTPFRLPARRAVLGVAVLAILLAAPAAVAQVTVNFQGDTVGAKPNGFTSTGSSLVHFTAVGSGANLQVLSTSECATSPCLAVFPDGGANYLQIDFDVPMSSISLSFGNDDPGFTAAGDTAVLTCFNGAVQVGQQAVVMNRNDLSDQTLSFSGLSFNRATVTYNVSTAGLIEVVDNIQLVPGGDAVVPALSWIGLGAFALALACGAWFVLRKV